MDKKKTYIGIHNGKIPCFINKEGVLEEDKSLLEKTGAEFEVVETGEDISGNAMVVIRTNGKLYEARVKCNWCGKKKRISETIPSGLGRTMCKNCQKKIAGKVEKELGKF